MPRCYCWVDTHGALVALALVTSAGVAATEKTRWRNFLDQFSEEQLFHNRAGKGFCSQDRGQSSSCRSISRRLLPEAGAPEIYWPKRFPFDADAFQREDETDDAYFYSRPRFVQHFGDAPRASLSLLYADVAATIGHVELHVDLCSSWVSHLPDDYVPGTIVGLGMNSEELAKNDRLTSFVVQDLNKNTTLPFQDDTVDLFTNAMSVDYLVRPLDVFEEMLRCLKPGGVAVMSFSNRFFPTKVIGAWHSTGDVGHCGIAMSYFHYTGFESIAAYTIHTGTREDPLYAVMGYKPLAGTGGPRASLEL